MRRAYDRIADRLKRPIPDRRVACWYDGHLLTGVADKSRHTTARRWRLFWRIKRFRRITTGEPT